VVKLFEPRWLRIPSIALVGVAIPLGCLAYMGGDLTGASLGLSTVTGLPTNVLGPLLGVAILMLIYWGPMRLLELVLITLVLVMAVVFLITLVIINPDWGDVARGLSPNLPAGSALVAVGLIGTTIVPYNLFVHSVNASKRFHSGNAIADSRSDIVLSIGVGGLITAAVLICAGGVLRGSEVSSVADLAAAVEPLLGSFAQPFISVGLIAAGVSSAIVTPLGASYVLAGLFGWRNDNSDRRFLAVNVLVLLFGIIISATGFDPVTLIVLAQFLNGLVLPVAVIFLVMITSQRRFMGNHANSWVQRILGVMVAMVCIFLGYLALI